jgi:preprotein translocase SecE subunit
MFAFLKEVLRESKKLETPTKKETYVTTITVVIAIIITSLAITFTDFIISKIIALIFGL